MFSGIRIVKNKMLEELFEIEVKTFFFVKVRT